jgi:hypothetical protein
VAQVMAGARSTARGGLSHERHCDGQRRGCEDVRDCSDIRKNESEIAKLLSEVGAEIMDKCITLQVLLAG